MENDTVSLSLQFTLYVTRNNSAPGQGISEHEMGGIKTW